MRTQDPTGFTTTSEGARLFVIGAACGLAIGTAVGLLFAPKPGRELRQQVSDSAQRAKRKATEVYDGASHKVDDVVARTRHAVHEGREAFRNARSGNGQDGPVDVSLS
jgi:gas vesicle protein